MRIKLEPRFWQFIIGLLTIGGGMSVYQYIQHHVTPEPQTLNSIDAWFPFWPWMIWVYISILPVFVVASVILNEKKFRKTWVRVVIGHLFAFPCFVLFPAAYPRPDISSLGPVHHYVFTWLHGFDAASNTLPSLHVCMTWIIMHELGKTPFRSIVPLIYALLVSASVLLVKQHFFSDMVFGFFLYGFTLPLTDWILNHYDRIMHPGKILEEP